MLLDTDLLGELGFERLKRDRLAKTTLLTLDCLEEELVLDGEGGLKFGETEPHLLAVALGFDNGLFGEQALELKLGPDRSQVVESFEAGAGADLRQRLGP